MRIPITKFGLPQVAFFSADLVGLMALCGYAMRNSPVYWFVGVEVFLLLILIWILAFFRDPARVIPVGEDILVSPADGTISDIESIDDPNCVGRKLLRIGIFLSVFNVHINRAPCKVKIDKINYVPGKFVDARLPESAKINESNDITMIRLSEPKHKLIVRQISGAIARRIVCDAREGQELFGGEKFGMIKFGSRTELYIPQDVDIDCLVKVGEKVKAGSTILARYIANE